MPTTMPRVQVSFNPTIYQDLQKIAKTRHIPLSSVVAELVEIAIEVSEDLALAQKSKERLKTFSPHNSLSTAELIKWNNRRKR